MSPTSKVILEAPPEPKTGTRYARVDRETLAEARELGQAHPGEWMRVATFPKAVTPARQAAYFARDIRSGQIADLKGAEAKSVTIDGEGVVYARFPRTEVVERPNYVDEVFERCLQRLGGPKPAPAYDQAVSL